jgi:signal transduction histidine kinase
MKLSRSIGVYSLLAVIWGGIVVWQILEHERVTDEVYGLLLDRSRSISYSMSVVFRSQLPFDRRGPVATSKERLEAGFNELIKWTNGVRAVALVGRNNEILASSARSPEDLELIKNGNGQERWDEKLLIAVNSIDIPFGADGPTSASQSISTTVILPAPPPGDPQSRGRRGGGRGDGRGDGRRPFWVEREQLVATRGLHSIVLVLSTEPYQEDISRDYWMRIALSFIALVATGGIGLAWHTNMRSSVMEGRLIRASEVNAHLQEMNLAAAGLAHETRNPLNIVRGQAQMIAKQADGVKPEVASRIGAIVEEVDRVTARLNQFLDYSKPRQVKPGPTDLAAVVRDVTRTMQSDLEDKAIEFEVAGPEVTIEADETLLRQVLFNLILNAIQSAERGGKVGARIGREHGDFWAFEVFDNGPGVPPEARDQIFRPYFTTHAGGTGLGLAVVRQIVLAHQWEIEYLPGESGGSRFRIHGVKGGQKAARSV